MMGTEGPVLATPTVSVVLIVRNGERYIAEALRSVLCADAMPTEVLVIDGGSTDRTAEIARGMAGVVVHAQRSRGIAAAYNEGIALASGELVAFISHDDVWLPGKLRAQVEFLAGHPDVECCITGVLHTLEAGASPPPGFRRELLERAVPGMIPECLVARRGVFARVGPFDSSFAAGEDTDWFARARDAGVEFALLPETYLLKRVHGSNASLTAPNSSGQLLRAMRASVERKRTREAGA